MSTNVLPLIISQLLAPTERLGAACRRCLLDDDDGFDRCIAQIEAMLNEPTGRFVCDCAANVALESTRLGCDAALNEREGHFHICAALLYFGNAWIAANEGGSDRLGDASNLLRQGLKHLDAGELALDHPELVSLPTNGEYRDAKSNVVRLPQPPQKITRMDAAQFRTELAAVTKQVAEACEHCCCKQEDCYRKSAKLFRRLLANRRATRAEPMAMDMEIVQAGFDALLDERDAHWHLAVAVRYTGYAWADIKWLDSDTLYAAIDNLDVATDHLRQANHGLAMQKECEMG